MVIKALRSFAFVSQTSLHVLSCTSFWPNFFFKLVSVLAIQIRYATGVVVGCPYVVAHVDLFLVDVIHSLCNLMAPAAEISALSVCIVFVINHHATYFLFDYALSFVLCLHPGGFLDSNF